MLEMLSQADTDLANAMEDEAEEVQEGAGGGEETAGIAGIWHPSSENCVPRKGGLN